MKPLSALFPFCVFAPSPLLFALGNVSVASSSVIKVPTGADFADFSTGCWDLQKRMNIEWNAAAAAMQCNEQ